MNNKLIFNLSFKNLKQNSYIIAPFLFANTVLFSILYIVASIYTNTYTAKIFKEYGFMQLIIMLGIILISLLIVVISLYGSKFIMKSRYKEFSLYTILGMEKKHVARIIWTENLMMFVLNALMSTICGYLFGSLAFLAFGKLLKQDITKKEIYQFSSKAFMLILVVMALVYAVNYIFNRFRIRLLSPVELMTSSKAVEKEPKIKFIMLILGIALTGSGYYIAATVEGFLSSITKFFLAVILVVLGTYCLYTSLSIAVLKMMKKNRDYYYKAQNFITVSNMLYRMKANAISLASIALLSTSLIVGVCPTFFAYLSSKEAVDNVTPLDVSISSSDSYDNDGNVIESEKSKKLDELMKEIDKKYKTTESKNILYKIIGADRAVDGDKIIAKPIEKGQAVKGPESSFAAIFYNLEDYNNFYKVNLELGDNEIFVAADSSLSKFKTIKIKDKEYQVKTFKKLIPSNIVKDFVQVIFKDRKEMIVAAKALIGNSGIEGADSMGFENVRHVKFANGISKEESSAMINEYNEIGKEEYGRPLMQINTKHVVEELMYILNGGLLFIGCIVAVSMLIATILMIYFKQISEGIEDKDRFEIMRKLGLDRTLIKKTMNSQLKWIFGLPALTAIIHTLFASNILYQISSQFGVTDKKQFVTVLAVVIVIFILVYLLVYKITSGKYYKIISRRS